MSAANPISVAKRTKLAKADAQRRKNFLIGVMRNEDGQAFLWEMLERCHVYQTPYTLDTNQTNFNLGEQNIGLRLLADITAASEAGYLEVLKYGQRRNRDSNSADDPGSDSSGDDPGDSSDSERGNGDASDDTAG